MGDVPLLWPLFRVALFADSSAGSVLVDVTGGGGRKLCEPAGVSGEHSVVPVPAVPIESALGDTKKALAYRGGRTELFVEAELTKLSSRFGVKE